MTKETAKLYLPLIQALAEGKTIQMNDLSKFEKDWRDVTSPNWGLHASSYRVKPEFRTFEIAVYFDGSFNSRQVHERDKNGWPCEFVKVQEIL